MSKKSWAFTIAAFLAYCVGISVFKTWQANKERDERERQARQAE